MTPRPPAGTAGIRATPSLRLTRRGRVVAAATVLVVAGGTVATVVLLPGSGPGTSAVAAAAPTSPSARAARSLPLATASPSTTTTPSAAPVPTVARDAAGVPLAVVSAVAAAGGDLSIAVYDATDGSTYAYQDQPGRIEASVSKLSILGATLLAQQRGAISASEVADDEQEMIGSSDNGAASDLYDEVGGGAFAAFDAAVGVQDLDDDSGGYFGLDTSSAADQVMVMRALAYPSAVLTDASRAQAASLLAQVESDQRWGATGGVPAGVTVQVKDGWLPHSLPGEPGWVVNTVGHVSGAGHDYVVAIMSDGNATEQAGIDRLEEVAAAVYATSGTTPAASTATAPAATTSSATTSSAAAPAPVAAATTG